MQFVKRPYLGRLFILVSDKITCKAQTKAICKGEKNLSFQLFDDLARWSHFTCLVVTVFIISKEVHEVNGGFTAILFEQIERGAS